ncbi:MAG: signal peptidase I [Erysipelotrichia bacterium]|nr:signal peptidase I [Erysipelotrichia bacterium]NCC54243.1 signal peptidase I [Erysipelotrichia bacterium]
MKIETKKEILNEVLYIFKTIVICSVAVFICVRLFFSPIHVDGTSMHPTLKDNDFGFSFVLASLFKQFHRFDVVMIHSEKENRNIVKRIIGLPNETIEYRNNQLYVDGKKVKETFFDKEYVNLQTFGGELDFTDDCGPYRLGDDEYFVMGDNRGASKDSRDMGAFKSKDILSKYAFIVFPFDHFNVVTSDD